MKRTYLITLMAVVIAGAVLAAVYHIGMTRGTRIEEQHVKEMETELQRLKDGEERASVAKRVAEQMEEIAHDERVMSDAQRDSAERQRLLAEEYARQAEKESRAAREAEAKANVARGQAEDASREAERERAKAEQKEQEALRSKNDADTLSYRNLARTLGNASVLARDNDNLTLARQLALTAWYFQQKYGDNDYQAEVFRALVGDDIREAMTPAHSAVYDIDVTTDGKAFAICSGYGEILQWKNGDMQTVFSDKRYDWRGMVQEKDAVWAMSYGGSLCRISHNGTMQEYRLPGSEYFYIEQLPDGRLLACARHRVVLFDVKTRQSLVLREEATRRFNTVAVTRQEVMYFYDNGSVGNTTTNDWQYHDLRGAGGDVVTRAHYDAASDMLYVGLASGNINVMMQGGRLYKTLVGHKAAITDMALAAQEGLLLSVGRDKELHIWNLKNMDKVSNVVSTSYKFDAWPMCVEVTGSKMLCGMSTGKVSQWELSPELLAKSTRDRIPEGLSRSDWNHYVGTRIGYVKLK